MAAGGFDEQIGQCLRAARAVRQAHQQIETPRAGIAAFDDLGDALALDHLLHRAQHVAGGHAVACRLFVIEADFQLRNQHLFFNLQIGHAGNFRKPLAQIARETAQGVEIVAIHFQRDLCAHAGEQVIEAMRDRLADVGRGRQRCQSAADVGDDVFTAARGGFEIHIHFGVMHALGMFVEFGAAGAPPGFRHFRYTRHQLFGERADAVGFGQRGARIKQHIDRQRTFVERRQERARKERHADRHQHHQRQRAREQGARMTKRPIQQLRIVALEPHDERAVAGMKLFHVRQQIVGHHRRQGHRDNHAGEDGNDVSDTERRKQPAFDTRQHKQRHEHEHDNHRRVNDGRAYFQRGRRDHLGHRARHRRSAIQFQAPQHVLDADHGIVHQFANSNGEPAERHGVDRQTEILENQRSCQQRHRNRHQRDDGGAHVQQEQEQDHRDQDRAIAQGLFHIVYRIFDEVGLLEEKGRCIDAFGQILAQFGNGFFDLAREAHAVGGRLLLHRQDYRRFALVTAIAAFGGRCHFHVGELL